MELKGKHAIIIGGSSGIGLATVRKLASAGCNVTIIHRDRKQTLEGLTSEMERLTSSFGVSLSNYNVDATNPEKIQGILDELSNDQTFHLVLHAVSRGNLKPFVSNGNKLSNQDLQLTIDAMGLNIKVWIDELLSRKLIGTGTRIVTLTSEGDDRFWAGYGAVALAKSALETMSRYLSVEMAPLGMTVNVIQAGITDTPSLRLIPGSEQLIKETQERNPFGRMTTPEDVANAIYLLTLPEALWINGALIHVDGGERFV